MIFIARDRLDEKSKPIKPSDGWFKSAEDKTNDAIAKKVKGEDYEIDDAVYGHIEVRKALEKLFHGKCAYCESPLEETGWNVEHYRPKGQVAERKDHPGYYWLAYRWDNFLPSCQPCNQRRQDKPTWDEPTPGATLGKLDQFPLTDESKRAMSHTDDWKLEKPLLFNPCIDDPRTEFQFNPKGKIIEKNQSRRLIATIKICHLQRRRLRVKRQGIIDRTVEFIKTIRMAQQEKPSLVPTLENLMRQNVLEDICYFAAVARYVNQHPERFGL